MSQADLDAERNALTTAKRAADALKHEQRVGKRRRIAEHGPGHVGLNLCLCVRETVARIESGDGGPRPAMCASYPGQGRAWAPGMGVNNVWGRRASGRVVC